MGAGGLSPLTLTTGLLNRRGSATANDRSPRRVWMRSMTHVQASEDRVVDGGGDELSNRTCKSN